MIDRGEAMNRAVWLPPLTDAGGRQRIVVALTLTVLLHAGVLVLLLVGLGPLSGVSNALAMSFFEPMISAEVVPGGKRRIETQLLHHDGEDWRGYSYAWRDDQTEAYLVPADGAEKVFDVPTAQALGGKREQVWTFHSRAQCISCHNAWSEYALAFNVGQLNGGGVGDRGEGVNQLVRLSQEGYIRRIDSRRAT